MLTNSKLKGALGSEVILDLPPQRDYKALRHAAEPAPPRRKPHAVFQFDKRKLKEFLNKHGKYADKHRQ